MPKQTDPLTDLKVRRAKSAEQPYRLADGKGLYLQVMPNGSKYWRMKYRFDGKEKLASFGVYPEVSLAEARQACLAARKLLAAGTDPTEQKREIKRARAIEASSSFEAVAREWFESQKDGWTEVYADKVINSLEVDAFPRIGSKSLPPVASTSSGIRRRPLASNTSAAAAVCALTACGRAKAKSPLAAAKRAFDSNLAPKRELLMKSSCK
ncbi:Arm DNA-binding domain-containing protein [Burkholderia sp. IO2]|uniref:tyrosine-type recombinase/integrase n=1 Tax=Burkholderia TaxID=32008 RepID=UPI000A5FAF6C|nr:MULTISPECIES: Arm DNA-binding domain-containing protein [Burkholderia]MDG0067949.1 Arm DNA-binding domain-containing protein [Burkholderia sp. IO2]